MIETEDQPRLVGWLCDRVGLAPTKNLRCIGRIGEKGDIIGVVGYDSFTNASVQMHVAGEGNWMSRSFLWAMFDYPFRVCELKVAYAIICSTNRKSLRLVERVGFRYEHTLADYYAEGDAIIMSMRPSECRYLRGNTNG